MQWMTACGVAVLIGGSGLAASGQAAGQAPGQPAAGQSSQAQSAPVQKDDEIVVTGCLAAENAAGDFILNDAVLTAEAKKSGNMQPNRSAPDTDAVRKSAQRYRLSGSDVNSLVGQRVQVTGTLEDVKAPVPGAAREAVGTSGSGSGTATDRLPRTDEDARTIHIREVKPVGGTCT